MGGLGGVWGVLPPILPGFFLGKKSPLARAKVKRLKLVSVEGFRHFKANWRAVVKVSGRKAVPRASGFKPDFKWSSAPLQFDFGDNKAVKVLLAEFTHVAEVSGAIDDHLTARESQVDRDQLRIRIATPKFHVNHLSRKIFSHYTPNKWRRQAVFWGCGSSRIFLGTPHPKPRRTLLFLREKPNAEVVMLVKYD